MDSLAFDTASGGPKQVRTLQDGPQLSFVRFTNPVDSTGENFTYLVESSEDMVNWTTANTRLINQVEVAEGMQRVTYTASSSLSGVKHTISPCPSSRTITQYHLKQIIK